MLCRREYRRSANSGELSPADESGPDVKHQGCDLAHTVDNEHSDYCDRYKQASGGVKVRAAVKRILHQKNDHKERHAVQN
jgi:hypothetical protein